MPLRTQKINPPLLNVSSIICYHPSALPPYEFLPPQSLLSWAPKPPSGQHVFNCCTNSCILPYYITRLFLYLTNAGSPTLERLNSHFSFPVIYRRHGSPLVFTFWIPLTPFFPPSSGRQNDANCIFSQHDRFRPVSKARP